MNNAPFSPQFTITPRIVAALARIEQARVRSEYLSLTPSVLTSLRETARLITTHYSTMIEGNTLRLEEVRVALAKKGGFAGRERDSDEVRGYHKALTLVEEWAYNKESLTEERVQHIHALVMGKGRQKVGKTAYRDGQNVIRDMASGAIVYLPPEASDVPALMCNLLEWIWAQDELAAPLVAAIAHYQFATIHPYYDGNGRTARLLTTFLLHQSGYDLRGVYSLEEYYAQDIGSYYAALTVGPSHNYYMGRADADITGWLEYFVEGMAFACEGVIAQMQEAADRDERDEALALRELDARQKEALALFAQSTCITTKELAAFYNCSVQTAGNLCSEWVEKGFFVVANPSNRARSYRLNEMLEAMVRRSLRGLS
jgi:Fic family protein